MSLSTEFWTPEQRRAIETADRSVLVGAAAGSGKTAVLARRCAHLVCEVPSPLRCDVDELLVVTFTESAASEMRDRIAQAIRRQLKSRPDEPRLRYQLASLDGAAVCTIHAFCRRVLNQWFALAGLDPGFEVLDPDEQLLLRDEAVERVFAALYDDSGPAGDQFRELIDHYADGQDRVIAEQLIHLVGYLESLVDPDAWLREALDWVHVVQSDRLPEDLGAAFSGRLRTELDWQLSSCRQTIEVVRSRFAAGEFIADRLAGHAEQLSLWRTAIQAEASAGLDRFTTEVRDYKFPTLRGQPKLPADSPNSAARERERAVSWFEQTRSAFRRRLQERWCLFSQKEMADGLERVAPVVGALGDLLERFRRTYHGLKERDGRLDFADLERRTLDLLTAEDGDNEVTRSLRRKYRYVFVDEYQDVNPIQERIIRLVSREPAPHQADNLFCVGDVKQSIYRFRLAEPEIFVARERRFRKDESSGAFVPLGRNFRSRSRLLDGINALFERIMTGDLGPIVYDEDARLVAGLDYPDEDSAPWMELHVLGRERSASTNSGAPEEEEADSPADWDAAQREAYWVGRRIRQLMGLEDGSDRIAICDKPADAGQPMPQRPVEFRDMVVLLRSVRHKAVTFARMLAAMEIPVHAELATGYFESTEVRDILAFLSLLDNRQQDIPLAAVLRSPIFEPTLDESDLVAIRGIEAKCPFHETFDLYARKGDDPDLAQRCSRMSALLDRFRAEMRRRPIADVLWQIYTETGCLAYVSGLPGGRQRRANLIKLHERARQFGTFSRQGLFRFLRFIQQLEQSGHDLGAAVPAGESENVVRIMTIHASKGLEFPVVFLADLAKRFNFEDARGRILASRRCFIGPRVVDSERGIEYPSIAHSLAADEIETETRAEEMRVLYVAMTRARERLIMVASHALGNLPREEVAAEWAGQEGALPPLAIATANSCFDWILPALGCQRSSPDAAFPSWLDLRTVSTDRMREWPGVSQLDKVRAEDRRRIAALEPLPPAEPIAADDPTVDRVIRRLSVPYAHNQLTTIPSVVAVTELRRRHQATREFDEQSRELAVLAGPERRFDWEWTAPGDASQRDRAAEQGTAMHLVLEHLDLRTAHVPDELAAQIDELVRRGLLRSDLAANIDTDAIRWFLQTRLGMELRRGTDRLRREVMFVARIAPEEFDPAARSSDPGDAMLVRGVIDVLLSDERGSQIIDYKTDRVEIDALPARAEAYRSQLDLYARAAEQLGAGPVQGRWLVFLSARRVWEMSPDG